jgi:hypothetical protein
LFCSSISYPENCSLASFASSECLVYGRWCSNIS